MMFHDGEKNKTINNKIKTSVNSCDDAVRF
jgi:hypothetical protein